jgi:hypothetical protein
MASTISLCLALLFHKVNGMNLLLMKGIFNLFFFVILLELAHRFT